MIYPASEDRALAYSRYNAMPVKFLFDDGSIWSGFPISVTIPEGIATTAKQDEIIQAIADEKAKVIYESSNEVFLYICKANIGVSLSASAWQIQRIEFSGNSIIRTWADGNALFDNVATDLATVEAISYS